jgi:hypothetical protein
MSILRQPINDIDFKIYIYALWNTSSSVSRDIDFENNLYFSFL